MPNYWTQSHVSRRSVLRGAGVGGVGIAGAALIGCSGGDDDAPLKPPAAGTSAAGAAAAQPKKGGTLRVPIISSPDQLDILSAITARANAPTIAVYSRLFQYKIGDGTPASGAVEGDLVDKWETPDDTTLVLKLRQGVTWDQRAPTNGRKFVADDVVQSWKKFVAKSPYAAQIANSASPTGSVLSLDAVDESTVRIKLAFPDAILFGILAYPDYFWVHPAESMNGGFDPVKDMRGTGPFLLKEMKTSVHNIYERNPKWHFGPDRPYIDSFEEVVIPDATQAEAQLRGGNLQIADSVIPAANLPSIVAQTKGMKLVLKTPSPAGPALGFSWRDGQPWGDVRLRRALSMSLDRDGVADVVYGVKKLKSAGFNVNTYWNTPVGPGYGPLWLDPKGKDFGPAAQYYQYNVAEAKKLLAAAGYDDKKPLKLEMTYCPAQYGADYRARTESCIQMFTEAGVQVKQNVVDYNSVWVPKNLGGQGQFVATDGGPSMDAHTNGGKSSPIDWFNDIMFSAGRTNQVSNKFPQLDELIKKSRTIYNDEQRKAAIWDVQRYMGDQQPTIANTGVIETMVAASDSVVGVDRWASWGRFARTMEEYTRAYLNT